MEMSLEELRAKLTTSDHGKVVDSLIAVEIGLEHYEAWWDAHCHMAEMNHPDAEEADLLASFLIDIGEIIGFSEVDFDKILGAAAE